MIDDDRVDRKAIKRSLKGQCHVTEAATLTRGSELLHDPGDFDCVVLDYRLPDGTAVEFLQRIREASEGLFPVPVVVVTGAEGDKVGLKSLAEGAQDYLFKAEVNATSLMRSVRYAIERHGLLVSLQERDKRLQQIQKVEAIGQLAGGVAHDFNNLLSVVLGYTELAMNALDQGKPIKRYLEAVHASGQRASDLTSQLLALGRQQFLKPRVVDLNELMERASQLLSTQLLATEISLVLVAGSDLPPVRVDPGQSEQALLNLGLNARDAMPTGGTLTLSTEAVSLSAREEGFATPPLPGPYVCLTVSDTGTGMDEGTLNRLFEPFFTTKAAGKGTGLGLASVHGFVQQSGGVLRVESELGVGTSFRIFLPVVTEPVEPPSDRYSHVIPASGCRRRVLLVEDEAPVRALCQEALTTADFEVQTACNGSAALEIFELAQFPFDLVVTDVMMPVMGGLELASALSTKCPELPVLLMSGYAEDPAVRKAIERADVQLIPKPITPSLLLKRVHELLGQGSI